jgi:serine/threonine-protein kinase
MRYDVWGEIGAGGTAVVHLGRLVGAFGFERVVAIKKLLPHLAGDPEFVTSFVDEAHIASRIRHANVVATLDVVHEEAGLFVVMEYVHGETLLRLLRASVEAGGAVPWRVATGVMAGVLRGLHAAHETKTARGEPTGLVHRDVSPQNIIVGVDGVARILDFGIAKALGRAQLTHHGTVKGKLGYMSPEQLTGEQLDRRTDVYAAGVVLWEALAGARLFTGDDHAMLEQMLARPRPPPPHVPAGLARIAERALDPERSRRYATAQDMALELEAEGIASPSEIGAWVESIAKRSLARRAEQIERTRTVPALMRLDSETRPRLVRRRARTIATGALLTASALAAIAWLALGPKRAAAPVVTAARIAPLPAPPPAPDPPPLPDAPPAPDPPLATPAPAPSVAPTGAARRTGVSHCLPPFRLDAQGHKHFLRECI